MKRLIFIFILSILFFVTSCTGDDDNVQKSIIRDILQEIQISFFQKDSVEQIMRFYHPDFYHKGNNFYAEQAIWEDRLVRINRIEIEIVDIDIKNDYALAYLKITEFDYQGHPIRTYIDHETEGDLSYFFHDFRDWKLIGNQFAE